MSVTLTWSMVAHAQLAATVNAQRSFTITVRPFLSAASEISVTCPDYYTALSGGIDHRANNSVYVSALGPTFGEARLTDMVITTQGGPTGYYAKVRNSGTTPVRVTITATCARITGVLTILGAVGVVSGSVSGQALHCPSGYRAMGGGAAPMNDQGFLITNSSFRYGEAPLFVAPLGRNKYFPTDWESHS